MDLEYLIKLPSSLLWDKVKTSLVDEQWILELKLHRGNGRDDYPIESLWQALLKVVVFKHSSVTELISLETQTIPPSSFSRFITTSLSLEKQLDALLFKHAPHSSTIALSSFLDSSLRYTYLFDAESGIPFYWHIGAKEEIAILQALELIEKAFSSSDFLPTYLIAPKEYELLCQPLWERFKIKPIIPLAREESEQKRYRDIVYDETAQPYCKETFMIFAGFEKDRNALKFRCAADHYGYQCSTYKTCTLRKGIRVPLKVDPVIFTPLPRSSYRWERLFSLYDKTAHLQKLLLKSIPVIGKKAFFLRISSLVYAAAYTKYQK